jgi:UDP:flavonoid glycosyltransferase YjiC (YdhE family)
MAIGKNRSVASFGKVPSNFIVVPYAPQIKLLPLASVVVTHGGVNSVNETLSFGKSMLVVHMGGDRIDMAARIVYRNAGIRLHAKRARAGRIQDAIIRLIKDPKYTQASEKIMHSFQRCDAPKTAADLIVRLADTRKPILRQKSAPITLENTDNLSAYLEPEP